MTSLAIRKEFGKSISEKLASLEEGSKKMWHFATPYSFDDDATFHVNFTQSQNGETSLLHRALLQRGIYLTRELLHDPHIDKNRRNKYGETPLLSALRLPDRVFALECIEELLKWNVDVKIHDCNGNSALHELSRTQDENFEKIFFQVVTQSDVNAGNYFGQTPLHLARSVKIAEELVKRKANVNFGDNSDNTPLHYAVDRPEICKFLLKNGAYPNLANTRSLTPLHEAININNEEAILLLLHYGANPNLRNYFQQTSLELAFYAKTSDYIKEELWKRVDLIDLIAAVKFDNSLASTIINYWNRFLGSKERVFFMKKLLVLLKKCQYHDFVMYGKVVVQYFMDNISKLEHESTEELIREFSVTLGRSPFNFIVKTYNYCQAKIVKEMYLSNVSEVLMEHGCKVDYSDLEIIYYQLGDCQILHKLLHFDVRDDLRRLEEIPLFPRVLCDLRKDVAGVVKNLQVCGMNVLNLYNIHNLARYCTLPKKLIEQFANVVKNSARFERPTPDMRGVADDVAEMTKLSGVPSLAELSRNRTRTALCEIFDARKPHELRLILRKLKIPPLIESLILMELPLNFNIKKPRYYPHARHLYVL